MTDLEQLARNRLSDRRFLHVKGVAATATDLARRFGADVREAATAAWLHDLFREVRESEMRELFLQVGLEPPSAPVDAWHGPLCVARLKQDFALEVSDAVRDAVAWHTLGDPQMGLLAQVVYVADAVEPSRDYEGVGRLRDVALRDLEQAVARVSDMTIAHLLEERAEIAVQTVELRNMMWSRVRAREVSDDADNDSRGRLVHA